MRKQYVTFVFLWVGAFIVSGCAEFKPQRDQAVLLDGESWVTEGNGKVAKHGAGESIQVSDKPVLIERPGHLGVLVLPPAKATEDFKLTLRPLSEFGGQYVDTYLNQYLTKLLAKVTEVQKLLSQGKATQALETVKILRGEHPKVSYLMFLEASCHVVAGDSIKAKALLQRGLEEFPNESQARNLYRHLAGGAK